MILGGLLCPARLRWKQSFKMPFMKPRIGKTFGEMCKETCQKEEGSRLHLLLPRTNPTLLQLAGCRQVLHASCGSCREGGSGASTVLWFCLLVRLCLWLPAWASSGGGYRNIKGVQNWAVRLARWIYYGYSLTWKINISCWWPPASQEIVLPAHVSVLSWLSLD